ncbi:MAG: sigma-54 dependent transcriptional regulator [Desulfotignum sp.]|nr:sigma-54 dependent transcriptional regulator [Desulfotignum sp.]
MDNQNRFRLLIVDDKPEIHQMMRRYFENTSHDLVFADRGQQALDLLSQTRVSLMLLDLKMPGMDGLAVLEAARQTQPGLRVIMLTAHGGISDAVAAMKLGALDFFEKSVDPELLRSKVNQVHEMWLLEQENRQLRGRLDKRFCFPDLVGTSPPMLKLKDMIARIAPTDTSVLIQGESGTGKELVARAIHHHSQRTRGPFCPVDCAAINETVVESELFGHAKGAFTGADQNTQGLFRSADTGTLFLDEVGELSLSMQAKLLRTLQERVVRPVGTTRAIPVDIRILAATNKNLLVAVSRGEFRQDLYYRLSTITLEAPPLRQIGDDILLLAGYLIERFSRDEGLAPRSFNAPAQTALKHHDWPGNVRELENVVRGALVLSTGEVIGPEDLSIPTVSLSNTPGNLDGHPTTMTDHEVQIIRNILETTAGNRREAAKVLGISEATLYRRIKQYNLA